MIAPDTLARHEAKTEPPIVWRNHWVVTYPITATEDGRPSDFDVGDETVTDGDFSTKAEAEAHAAELMLIPSRSGAKLFGGCMTYLGAYPEPAP